VVCSGLAVALDSRGRCRVDLQLFLVQCLLFLGRPSVVLKASMFSIVFRFFPFSGAVLVALLWFALPSPIEAEQFPFLFFMAPLEPMLVLYHVTLSRCALALSLLVVCRGVLICPVKLRVFILMVVSLPYPKSLLFRRLDSCSVYFPWCGCSELLYVLV